MQKEAKRTADVGLEEERDEGEPPPLSRPSWLEKGKERWDEADDECPNKSHKFHYFVPATGEKVEVHCRGKTSHDREEGPDNKLCHVCINANLMVESLGVELFISGADE